VQGYLSQIISQAKTVPNLWGKLHDNLSRLRSLSDTPINLTEQVPGTYGSINQIGARLCAVYGVMGGFQAAPEEDYLIFPQQDFINLLSLTNNIQQALERITSAILPDAPNPVHFVDGNPWAIVNQNSSLVVSLENEFLNLANNVEAVSTIAVRLVPILSLNEKVNLSGLAETVSAAISQLNNMKQQAGRSLSQAQERSATANEAIETNLAKSTSLTQDINSLLEKSQETETRLQEIESRSASIQEEIKKYLSVVETLNTTASELRGAVTTYQTNFDDFQRKLLDREKQLESGNIQVGELSTAMTASLDRLKQLQAHAENVIESAKDALSWGSESGLARSFSEAATEQDNKLGRAELAFYVSIVFMLILIAVAIGIIPIFELPKFTLPESGSPAFAFIQLLAAGAVRVLIILPAWLALSFANTRYRSLMRMKEAYLFKKTIAAALPGFKESAVDEDATEHAKKITVSAFENLLFNPQESDAHRDDLDWLRKTPREVIIEALKTVRESMKLGKADTESDR